MNPKDKAYCIVDDDDTILLRDLTLDEAEHELPRFLNEGEDCYIGETRRFEAPEPTAMEAGPSPDCSP